MNLFGNVNLLGWFADANSGGTVTGSGTANTIPLWTSASVLGDSKITQAAGGTSIAFTPTANTTGSTATFTLTNPNNTGRTLSTEVFGLSYVGGTQTWATGAIATQREINIASPTYAFVGASVITNAYTFYANAPTAGANATITDGWAIGTNGGIYITAGASSSNIKLRDLVGASTYAAIYMNTAVPTVTNAFILSDGINDTYVNAPSASSNLTLTKGLGSYYISFKGDLSGSAFYSMDIRNSERLAMPVGSFAPPFNYTYQQATQWATGAISTQSGLYIYSPTWTAVGASVMSNSYNLFVNEATAGANITITNNFAIGTTGNISVSKNASTFTGIYTTNATNNASAYTGVSFITNGVGSGTVFIGATASSNTYVGASRAVWYSQRPISIFVDAAQPIDFCINGSSAIPRLQITATGTSVFNANGQANNVGVNSNIFKVTGITANWATGALATQYFNYFSANTVTFAGASTATNVYGLYVEAATAGTNATITNNWAAGFSGGVYVTERLVVGVQLATSPYGNSIVVVPNTTEGVIVNRRNSVTAALTLGADASSNASLNVTNADYVFNTSSVERFRIYQPLTSGSTGLYLFTAGATTGQTASTEISAFKYTGSSRQWNTGAITTQRETYFSTTTYTAVGASVITNAYGFYVEAPTASTNVTITNNWAFGVNGGIFLNGTANTVLGAAALATNATTGFLHIPSCAGVPTGVPTLYTGMVPLVADSTNNKLYIYSGSAWVALN